MKLIFCTDERGGMAFNKRRVSRDKLMIADLAEYVGDEIIYAEPYSEELFSGTPLNLICSSSPERSAEEGEFVFLETRSPKEAAQDAEELIIYNWQRRYPFDTAMGFRPEELGFKLKSRLEFKGNSHDLIIREVYFK